MLESRAVHPSACGKMTGVRRALKVPRTDLLDAMDWVVGYTHGGGPDGDEGTQAHE